MHAFSEKKKKQNIHTYKKIFKCLACVYVCVQYVSLAPAEARR